MALQYSEGTFLLSWPSAKVLEEGQRVILSTRIGNCGQFVHCLRLLLWLIRPKGIVRYRLATMVRGVPLTEVRPTDTRKVDCDLPDITNPDWNPDLTLGRKLPALFTDLQENCAIRLESEGAFHNLQKDLCFGVGRGTLSWFGALCFPFWVSVSLFGVLGVYLLGATTLNFDVL